MTDSQDDSGVDLYGVKIDPAAYADASDALYVYRQTRGDASYTGVVCDVTVQAVADGRVKVHEAVHQLRVDALVWHHTTSDTPPALVLLLHRAGPEFARAVAEATPRPSRSWTSPGPRASSRPCGGSPDGPADPGSGRGAGRRRALHRRRPPPCRRRPRGVAARRQATRGRAALRRAPDGRADPVGVPPPRLRAARRRPPARAARREFEVHEVAGPPEPAVGSMGLYVGSRWYDVRLPAHATAGRRRSRRDDPPDARARPPRPGAARPRPHRSTSSPRPRRWTSSSRAATSTGAPCSRLAPPPPDALIEVADAGEVMPPKTTYFEPKPAAGIFLRRLGAASRASSSSTTDGSSLVKTGVGFSTFVPTATGRLSHRGVPE